jgi:hypothetical protein
MRRQSLSHFVHLEGSEPVALEQGGQRFSATETVGKDEPRLVIQKARFGDRLRSLGWRQVERRHTFPRRESDHAEPIEAESGDRESTQ